MDAGERVAGGYFDTWQVIDHLCQLLANVRWFLEAQSRDWTSLPDAKYLGRTFIPNFQEPAVAVLYRPPRGPGIE